MQISSKRLFFYLILLLLYGAVIGITIISDLNGDLTYTSLRLAALLGYLSLSGAVIMNLFKPEIQKILGRPFLPIHHAFAITGVILITIHPILFVILTSDLSVFIPDTSSLYYFVASGGRVAIILVYVVFLAGLFRSALKLHWKLIHRLIYPAMIIAIIHANIMGATFQNAAIWVLYNGMAAGILFSGIVRSINRKKNNDEIMNSLNDIRMWNILSSFHIINQSIGLT